MPEWLHPSPHNLFTIRVLWAEYPLRTRYRITSHDQTSRRLRPSPESLTVYTGSFIWIYHPHGRCTTQHRYYVNLTATNVGPLDTKCPLLFSNQPSIPFADLRPRRHLARYYPHLLSKSLFVGMMGVLHYPIKTYPGCIAPRHSRTIELPCSLHLMTLHERTAGLRISHRRTGHNSMGVVAPTALPLA
jgi:hypothetical protein